MRILGRTERRVVSAILVTALVPLVASIFLARAVIERVSSAAFQPEFSGHLHSALGVYRELASAIKQGMRYEADAIASSSALKGAADRHDPAAMKAELAALFKDHPSLVSINIETCGGVEITGHDRGSAVDPAKERALTVRKAIGGGDPPDECGDSEADDERREAPARIAATFATPRERFDELESFQEFATAYDEFAQKHREQYLDRSYRNLFVVLLGFTILLAVLLGILVVRPVTNRIKRLAAATRPVAEGDLSVRVSEEGRDEVADLGRAFNRMLEELERSRARVEFLRRIGEWQKMARRLAHEIKNPLTPIQLAVEECHRRYAGDDPAYKRILETTAEVVTEEVSSLRRLVSEFANFARLPRAELSPGDLGEFLRVERARFAAVEGGAPLGADGEGALLGGVELTFDVPDRPMPAELDREMMHRALINIVRNASQAIRDKREREGLERGAERDPTAKGRIHISAAAEGDHYVIDIDDDGDGIPPDLGGIIFDPYVTTKRDGNGLGLSIVKKIIVDHGGTIDAAAAPLGGARFHIRVPRAGTAEARAASQELLRSAASPDP